MYVACVFIEFYDIPEAHLTLACDNDASLIAGTTMTPTTKIDPTYFDIISEISSILKDLPLTVKKNM